MASMMLEPLGEVGANFSLQLSLRTQFTKINNKKGIAKNQCEKHKKSSLNHDPPIPRQYWLDVCEDGQLRLIRNGLTNIFITVTLSLVNILARLHPL